MLKTDVCPNCGDSGVGLLGIHEWQHPESNEWMEQEEWGSPCPTCGKERVMSDKAKIAKVGEFGANGEPQGWMFDGLDSVPAFEIKDGEILWAGYTEDELREIKKLNDAMH